MVKTLCDLCGYPSAVLCDLRGSPSVVLCDLRGSPSVVLCNLCGYPSVALCVLCGQPYVHSVLTSLWFSVPLSSRPFTKKNPKSPFDNNNIIN